MAESDQDAKQREVQLPPHMTRTFSILRWVLGPIALVAAYLVVRWVGSVLLR